MKLHIFLRQSPPDPRVVDEIVALLGGLGSARITRFRGIEYTNVDRDTLDKLVAHPGVERVELSV